MSTITPIMPLAYRHIDPAKVRSEHIKPRKLEVAGAVEGSSTPDISRKEMAAIEKNSAVYNMDAKANSVNTEASKLGNHVNLVA